MGILNNIFGQKQSEPEELEPSQAVIISFDLSDEFGAEEERKRVHTLEDKLNDVLVSSKLGDIDGDEFGDDEVTIYAYGLDADKILEAIEPVLIASEFKPVRAVVRYGVADDPNAKEKKHILT